MNHMKDAGLLCALALVTLFIAGCGGGSDVDLAQVEGTVTLDGKPLAGVNLEFTPAGESGGSPSYSSGPTDANGHYKLMYTFDKPGAMVGKHTVRITTAAPEGEDDEEDDETVIEEKLPARYNAKTELTADVQPGSNTIDFDLKSE